MLKGSDLWLWLWLWLTDPLWKYIYGAPTPKSLEMVLSVIKQTSLHIVCRFLILKGIQIALLIQMLRHFAWICWAESRNYSAHQHFRNHTRFRKYQDFYQAASDTWQSDRTTMLQLSQTGSTKKYLKVLRVREIDILTYRHINIDM